jgi:hypothetical protein
MQNSQKSKRFRLVLSFVLFLLGFGQSHAEESFVTLWAGSFGGTNELSMTRLTLKTNETAHLVSWPQMEFRYSFLSVKSGLNSTLIERKPEILVDEKTRSAKKLRDTSNA